MAWLLRRAKGTTSNASANDTGEIDVRLLADLVPPRVVVAGRVTMDSSPALRKILLAALGPQAPPLLEIDFTSASFMDTSGVATLLEALRAARQRGVALHAMGMGGQLKVVAEVFELQSIFRMAGSEVLFQ